MLRKHTLQNIRNIGIMAHIDAGKTTTTERVLFYTGLTHKIGEVHEGHAVMDWMSQEQERGITITSAATICEWKNTAIHLIDTPGHVDFTVEVERSLRILDGAIFLLDAKEGVEAQTETVWRQANHYTVPRLVFVNKMDVVGADFDRSVQMIKTRLKATAVPIQVPLGIEKDFQGHISLIDMMAYFNTGHNGEEVLVKPIPDDYIDTAKNAHNTLIETLAEYHDELMVRYLEGQDIPSAMLQEVIRTLTLTHQIVPVLCGAAYRNKGIQALLDAIVAYLPSPLDRPTIKGFTPKGQETYRQASDQEPFSGLIFKIMTDPYVGRLTFMRVYSGAIKVGGVVYNTNKAKKERIGKILHMHANARQEVEAAYTGDIVALIGLKQVSTGDTLCDMNAPILLEAMDFPTPVIAIAVESKTPAEMDKVTQSLERLCEEDPTLQLNTHPETGQLLVSGMGELHLEIVVDRLAKEFGLSVRTGKPQVAYKETLQMPVKTSYLFDKTVGQQHMYASVTLRVSPNPRGHGNRFSHDLKTKKIPDFCLEACKEGVRLALQSGVIAGYEVVDVDVVLLEALFHEESSSEVAFKTAASLALSEALKKGNPVLLEPIMTLNIHAPEQYVGEIIEDIQTRQGTITAIEPYPTDRLIKATAPLSKLFGYATDLRSKTQGRGQHTLQFSHFDHQ